MPLSEIAKTLVRRSVVAREAAVQAEQRQQLYGGGLDTALLELGATDEETLLTHLAEIVGVPRIPAAMLGALPDRAGPPALDLTTAHRLGAAPFARHADALDVWVRPEHDHEGLVAWSATHAVLVEPFLVSEVRFRVLLQSLYGVPVAPRYLALLAKLVGTLDARRVLGEPPAPPTPTPVVVGVDPVETFVAAARLGHEAARTSALRHLACRLSDPRVIELRRGFEKKAADANPAVAKAALQALAQLRDKEAVPALVDLLEAADEGVAAAVQATLTALTCADFGRKRKRWLDWWGQMRGRSRIEWLLEGLAHKVPEIRLLASNELYEVCGEYFGYHYDLPEPEREQARRRWVAWWQKQSCAPASKRR